MADQIATLGLNRREFSDGLRAAGRESDDFARNFKRSVGGIEELGKIVVLKKILGDTLRYAGEAVNKFAADNDAAMRIVKRWEETAGTVKKAIGGDLVGAMQGFQGDAEGVFGWLERRRKGIVNGLADVMIMGKYGAGFGHFDDSAAAVDEARKGEYDSARSMAATIAETKAFQRASAFEASSGSAAAIAGMGPGSERAQAVEREMQRHREAADRIREESNTEAQLRMRAAEDDRHKAELAAIDREERLRKDAARNEIETLQRSLVLRQGLVGASEKERTIREAVADLDERIAKLRSSGRPDDAGMADSLSGVRPLLAYVTTLEAQHKETREVRKIMESAGYDIRSDDIAAMRDRRYYARATRGELELDSDRRVNEITADQTLSPQQKGFLTTGVRQSSARRVAAALAAEVEESQRLVREAVRGRSFRSLESGGVSAIGIAAAFGGAAGQSYQAPSYDPLVRAQERLERAVKEQTDFLEQIRDNTAKGTVARAG